ncbi:MAG: hypothetical protein M1814_000341 [Vezdaea aestivalis]|nr:MAG: hypothetical protein M1814_000341 [Vezdaea aestivalis]
MHLLFSSPLQLPLLLLLLSQTTCHPLITAPQLPLPAYKIPTPFESALLARRLLHLVPNGILSSTFPSTSSPYVPSSVASLPVGMPDYISDCSIPNSSSLSTDNDPSLLAISIATTFRNAEAGSNVSLALSWDPPHGQWKAALPRVSLIGYLESINGSAAEMDALGECFAERHPDSRAWFPGNPIHQSKWVRLRVRELYWVGGFGDRAYIGWIDGEVWRGLKREDWEEVRLPGEL